MSPSPQFIAAAVVAFVALAFVVWRFRDLLLRGIPSLSAEALGLFRVVFGSALLYAILRYEPVRAEGTRDYEWWGSWEWLDRLATSAGAVDGIATATTVALALFTVGLLTRLAYGAAAVGVVLMVLVHLESGGQHDWGLPMLVVLAGLVVPWGDGFSVDEAIRRLRGKASPHRRIGPAYGLGVWLPGFLLGVAWAAAAYAKVAANGGLEWALGGAVQYHWVEDAANAPVDLGLWIASHESLAIAMSVGGLALEALFISHVFFRGALVRGLYGLVALSLLAGFYVFQGVFWFPWWMLLLAFLPWQRLWTLSSSLLPTSVVLVDQGCPMCRRTARALHAMDLFNRLQFVDAGDDGARARWLSGVSRERALESMYAVRPETRTVREGLGAYLLLGHSLPVLWPVVAAASLPGVRHAGEAVYARVAERRSRDHTCTDATCEIPDAGRGDRRLPATPFGRPAVPAMFGPGVAVLLAFVVVWQGAASRLRVEREPFISNYPMYSGTFESRAAYDEHVERSLRDPRIAVAGGGPDITDRLAEMDNDTGVLVDVAESAIDDAEGAPALVPAEDTEALADLRSEYEEEYGTELDAVDVYATSRPFDWEEGRFGAREEVRVASIVGDWVLVAPVDAPIDVIGWPDDTSGYAVALGTHAESGAAVRAGEQLIRRGFPTVGILDAGDHDLGPAGRTVLFAGLATTREELEPYLATLRELGHTDARVIRVES